MIWVMVVICVQVCVLQDTFTDEDGSCYVYEISVRHCDVRGMPGYVTADVMLLLYAAKPVKNSKGTCNITIISQVSASHHLRGKL